MSSSLIVEYLDEVEEGHLGLAATEEMLPKLVLDRGVLPPSSVGEMTLRLYSALSYSQNSACDLRRALNGA